MTVAEVLRAAADIAERQPTTTRAVAYGWSACHREPEQMIHAFRAWAAAEDFTGPIPDLGEVLRRRYQARGPVAVAVSLRTAALLVEQAQTAEEIVDELIAEGR